jgi:hypothetical protein
MVSDVSVTLATQEDALAATRYGMSLVLAQLLISFGGKLALFDFIT